MNRVGTLHTVLLVVLGLALVLAVADLLVVTLSVLLLLFAGVLFGVFLNAPSCWLARNSPLSYRAANLAIVIAFVAMVVAGTYYMGQQGVKEATELQTQMQSSFETLLDRIKQYEWSEQLLPKDWKSAFGDVDQGVLSRVVQGVQGITWALTSLLVIFFVGMYVAFDPRLYEDGLVRLVPPDKRQRAGEVLQKLRSVLAYWILGRLISMSAIAVLTAIGLGLLGVPLPIPLGILAGLLTFIPNIGPILAAVPQMLLALEIGMDTVLYVLIFNLALQGVESYLVTPLVQQYVVSLPPALTISVQLLLGVLIGIMGVVMAAPLTAAVLVLVQMLYIQDRLGDPDPGSFA